MILLAFCGILGGKSSLRQGYLEVSPKRSFAPAHLQRARASVFHKRKTINCLNRSFYEASSGQQGPQIPAEFSAQVGHLLSLALPEDLVDDRMCTVKLFHMSQNAEEKEHEAVGQRRDSGSQATSSHDNQRAARPHPADRVLEGLVRLL